MIRDEMDHNNRGQLQVPLITHNTAQALEPAKERSITLVSIETK